MNRTKTIGLLLLVGFTVSQGLRDVYLASAFGGIGFFDLVFLAFSTATLFFTALLFLIAPANFQRVKAQWRGVLAVHVYASDVSSCSTFCPATVMSNHKPLLLMAFILLSN